MNTRAFYWRGWDENQLADYQQNQGQTNHCAKYAAAAALNMLYGTSIQGGEIVAWLETRFLDGTPRYTVFGNTFGSLVVQTAEIVRAAAALFNLSPQVSISRGSREDLLTTLDHRNQVEIISITYLNHNVPRISYGTRLKRTIKKPNIFGGHIMVLGAYDPTHLDEMDQPIPWGFISSWSGHEYLYWMPEQDFLHSWGRYSPFRRVTVRG